MMGPTKLMALYGPIIPFSVGFQELSKVAQTDLSTAVITMASPSTSWESQRFIFTCPSPKCPG